MRRLVSLLTRSEPLMNSSVACLFAGSAGKHCIDKKSNGICSPSCNECMGAAMTPPVYRHEIEEGISPLLPSAQG